VRIRAPKVKKDQGIQGFAGSGRCWLVDPIAGSSPTINVNDHLLDFFSPLAL
jgi:hypothetical protein